MATPRLMIILFAAIGVVVAAIAALVLESWVLLVAVLAVHLVATGLVVVAAWNRASDASDKPDPVTEARIDEERTGDRYSGAAAGTS